MLGRGFSQSRVKCQQMPLRSLVESLADPLKKNLPSDWLECDWTNPLPLIRMRFRKWANCFDSQKKKTFHALALEVVFDLYK